MKNINEMLNCVKVFCHSSIMIDKGKIIYIDPFNVDKRYNNADIILITHSHYDHFSKEDIMRVKKSSTVIVVTEDLEKDAIELGFKSENIITVFPNRKYNVCGFVLETIPSYNVGKKFHPKSNNWVGYIITIDGIRMYIAGDTDVTKENKEVHADMAFIPIGGTYTMDKLEAASLVNMIKPKVVIPIHYGSIVGKKEDAYDFKKLLDMDVECRILIN